MRHLLATKVPSFGLIR